MGLLRGPFVVVVVVRSFRYGGCCELLSLWWLSRGSFVMVVVRSFRYVGIILWLFL